MPDMQFMLDNFSVAQIRKMTSSFRARSPRERVGLTPASLLLGPVSGAQRDALNHVR